VVNDQVTLQQHGLIAATEHCLRQKLHWSPSHIENAPLRQGEKGSGESVATPDLAGVESRKGNARTVSATCHQRILEYGWHDSSRQDRAQTTRLRAKYAAMQACRQIKSSD
jgi:hypothetical protein